MERGGGTPLPKMALDGMRNECSTAHILRETGHRTSCSTDAPCIAPSSVKPQTCTTGIDRTPSGCRRGTMDGLPRLPCRGGALGNDRQHFGWLAAVYRQPTGNLSPAYNLRAYASVPDIFRVVWPAIRARPPVSGRSLWSEANALNVLSKSRSRKIITASEWNCPSISWYRRDHIHTA